MPLGNTPSTTVLIVDDVPDNVAMLHDVLDEAGLHRAGGPGWRGSAPCPGLCRWCCSMPSCPVWFEVARQLKGRPATAAIPIVFMTGLTDTEHLEPRWLPVGWTT